MRSRGILGFAILLAVAGLWSSCTGPSKLEKMEQAIQGNLDANGANFATVNMAGNVATLTGAAPSELAMADAENVAKNTECTFCKGKDRVWHTVKNDMTSNAVPVQSPYTFSGQKTADGNVAITGFVGSQAAKENVIAKAKSVFGAKLVSTSVTVAEGAPTDSWNQVVQNDMEQLNLLDTGRFAIKDTDNFITGQAASTAIREQINSSDVTNAEGYSFRQQITVAEISSQGDCQALFDGITSGKKIEFESSRADIKGAASFNLLNNVASAANQCRSFTISVEGHTDSQGDAGYNQRLSEQRANAVVVYLRNNNVDASRLRARGFGESQPIGDNRYAPGRAQNRRIEFKVTESQ